MEPLNSWIVLLVGVFAFVGSCLFILKVLDWCYAVVYEWRMRRAGRRSASPSPSGSPALLPDGYFADKPTEPTPDRPTDPYMTKVRNEIEVLINERAS